MINTKRISLFVFLFSGIITFYIGYNFYDESPVSSPSRVISVPRTDRILYYRKHFDTNRSFGYLWGIEDLPVSRQEKHTEKQKNTSALPTIKAKDHTLCIGSTCYRIVGIYARGKTPYVTLFGKQFRHGMRDYTLHEILDDRIVIQQIDANSVLFYDINSSQEWHFDFFDVNTSKYKPKDHNVTQF